MDKDISVDEVPHEEIDKLEKVYESYDSDQDGVITCSEFTKLVSLKFALLTITFSFQCSFYPILVIG